MGATHILKLVPTTCGPFVGHSRPHSKLFWVLFKHVSASPTHGEGAAAAGTDVGATPAPGARSPSSRCGAALRLGLPLPDATPPPLPTAASPLFSGATGRRGGGRRPFSRPGVGAARCCWAGDWRLPAPLPPPLAPLSQPVLPHTPPPTPRHRGGRRRRLPLPGAGGGGLLLAWRLVAPRSPASSPRPAFLAAAPSAPPAAPSASGRPPGAVATTGGGRRRAAARLAAPRSPPPHHFAAARGISPLLCRGRFLP